MKVYDYNWKADSNMPKNDVAFAITHIITSIVKDKYPEYLKYFPFQGGFLFECFFEDDYAFFQLTNREVAGLSMPAVGTIKDLELIEKLKSIRQIEPFPSFEDVIKFDSSLFSVDQLTYVGSQHAMTFSWEHFHEYIIPYLVNNVLPKVIDDNRKRVADAIPTPPQYDVQKIFNNIYIIESEKMAMQGTCFYLTDVGFVTCQHSIFDDSVIFKASEIGRKNPVRILKQNPVIDLAIFEVPEFKNNGGLDIGNSDEIDLNANISAAGFPNYNYGDSGIFSPGLVVGFRTISSIKRLLVNIPLIAGMSGSPIISNNNTVIGVAVTGADKMEEAHLTEKHGIIPISAIRLL